MVGLVGFEGKTKGAQRNMTTFHLKRWQIAAYSAPSIPNSALGLPVAVYLPAFYAEQAGLAVAAVGTIFMLARFWDVFTDPFMGILSDRFPTRWGRRRHWIVLSVPIMMLAAWQLFIPPEGVGVTHLLIWMFVLYVGYTLLTISHISWGAELTPDYHERSRVQGWREFALVLGMFTVLALPALIEITSSVPADPPPVAIEEIAPADAGTALSEIRVEDDGHRAVGRDRVAAMGWFVIILLPLTVAFAVTLVGERPVKEQKNIDWHGLWTVISKNKSVRRLLLVDIIAGFGPSVSGALYIWFIAYYVGYGDWASRILLLYFVAAFIAVPFWIQISYKIGKHKALTIAFVYSCVILATYLISPNAPLWVVLLLNMAYGFAYGAGPFLLRSMMADVRDYDLLETGQERTGLYFSLLTMTSKIGAALAVGLALTVLGIVGFDPSLGEQNSERAVMTIGYMFVFLPMVVYAAGAWLIWNFPLDQAEQEKLRAQIDERHRNEGDHGAIDTLTGYSPPRGEIEDQPAE